MCQPGKYDYNMEYLMATTGIDYSFRLLWILSRTKALEAILAYGHDPSFYLRGCHSSL
jgi:hypothetical protein